jgi:ketosteroid isomerase-like protein
MASENVKIVRAIYEDWARGDFSGSEWADPEIEFEIVEAADSGRATGRAEMAELWGSFLSAWTDLRAEAEEILELDEGRVLVLARNSGIGKTSGLELDDTLSRGANVFEIRDGKVTKLEIYSDRDRAMAELGLDRSGEAGRR